MSALGERKAKFKEALAQIRLKMKGSLSLAKFFSTKPLLGVDIGNRTAKAVVARRSSSGIVVDKTYSCSRVDESTQIMLRQMLEAGGDVEMPSSFSISDEKVEVHEFHLPELSRSELKTASEFEVKKAIPSPDYVYHDVLTYPGFKGSDVQCVVAARDIVQAKFDEAKSMGVSPKFLETESSALLSCLEATFPKRKLDRIAIADLGYLSFRIIFVHGGRISFTRALYFGVASITHQAAAQLGAAVSDLEPMLKQLGKVEGGEKGNTMQTLERAFQESLYGLSEEFRRSEFYVRDQKALEETDEIFLAGGAACYPSVTEYLGRHLSDKKITLLDPFVGAKTLPPDVRPDTGPLWACAVGLSLRSQK